MHNSEKKLLSPLKQLEKTTIISMNLIAFSHKHSTVEPRFNKVAGDRLNSFFKLRFFFIYFTITGAKNTVRYIKVFV